MHWFYCILCSYLQILPTVSLPLSCLRSTFLITTVRLCRSVVRPGDLLQRLLLDDLGNKDEPHPPGQGGGQPPRRRVWQRRVGQFNSIHTHSLQKPPDVSGFISARCTPCSVGLSLTVLDLYHLLYLFFPPSVISLLPSGFCLFAAGNRICFCSW